MDDVEATYFDTHFGGPGLLELDRDVAAYAARLGGPSLVIDLLAGTGRVTLPLARAGHDVIAVDRSRAMVDVLRAKVLGEPSTVRRRVRVVCKDVFDWAPKTPVDAILLPFHGLNCMSDWQSQRDLLVRCHEWLRPRGLLAFDVVNPLRVPVNGDDHPRRSPPRPVDGLPGASVVCTSMHSPVSVSGTQVVSGFFDERSSSGVRRVPFEFAWRLATIPEIVMMLESAGFTKIEVFGGFGGEPPSRVALRWFFVAERSSPRAAAVGPRRPSTKKAGKPRR